jgi:hypothetical protein
MKPTIGGNIDNYDGTGHNVIKHICMESKAYKICEGWATQQGDATFPTYAIRRNEFWQIHYCSGD